MNTTTDRQPPITPERLNHIRSALAVVTSDQPDSHAELDKANAQWTVHSEQYAADLLAEVDRQAGLLALALEHLAPCPPPDIAHGWDLCPHGEKWPCKATKAAWQLRGLDPDQQIVTVLDDVMRTWAQESAGA